MDAWAQVFASIAQSPGEFAAGLAAVCGFLFFVALWRTALRLDLALAGDPENGGHLTASVRLGPLRIDWQKHSGQPARRTLRLLGLRMARAPRVSKPHAEKSANAPKKAKTRGSSRAPKYFLRHWNLGEVGAFLWRRRRDIRISPLEGRIEFGFAEPERTGETYGALCALTGVIPPLRAEADGSIRAGDLSIRPDWSLEDRLAGHARGGLEIRVGRAAIATLFFLVTHWHPARRGLFRHA